MTPPPPFRIGLLLYEECMQAGLFAFADLVRAANRRAGQPLFETVFVAEHSGPVLCAHGQTLHAEQGMHSAALDAILIPGFWAEAPQQVGAMLDENKELVASLRRLPAGIALWSYCTGVCLAAATGRLNGHTATVTWWLADLMRKTWTRAAWKTERTCVVNANNATASGVNGYLPIAQAFIETRLSQEAYRDLTKLMVLPRPEATHHAFRTMSLIEQPDQLVRQLHVIAEQLPATEATVERLASAMNMTTRTLSRKVQAATGTPIAGYVRRIKLHQVSERLIHTSAPASSISEELGFASDAGMRRMFKDMTAMTPVQYRQAFGRHA